VKRASYTRRFTFLYVLLTSLVIVLVAVFSRIRSNRLHQQRIHERFLSIQNLLISAYQQMPMDAFIPWLENSNLQAWASLNWNVIWLGPDLDVRWSIYPVESKTLPIQLIEEHRAKEVVSNGSARPPLIAHRQANAIHLEALSRSDPEAGWLLLYSPLPRFFLDGAELWSTVGLLGLLLGGNFLLYQRLMRRQVRNIIESSGLSRVVPPPGKGQTIEKWARRYASLASRKIEESQDQFDRLFEILQDGIFLVDSQNQVLRANSAAAALLGEPLDTLIGRPISEMKEHIVLENFTSEIRITSSYQAREVQLESNSTLCNIAGIPILEEEVKGPTPVMIILHDLTRLRQLERAGEDYAVNVSHELKTPLTLIQGFTETLLSHDDMDVEARSQALHTIERHAKRISRIIDDLLRLAWLKNEAYTLGIPRALVPIDNIINETVFMCDEWARNAGITIKADVPENLMWKLNSGLMEEALINLVKNAILYAIVGPVEIQARVLKNGQLQFAVIDRGPGLKPEDAQHIFDRFYRADKSRTRASGGSGLGLPIVQQIVEAHNGTARVDTAPGEGCTFILEIPAID
jgi:PAS domain S-box-containing protein